MLRVVAARDAIMIFKQNSTVRGHEDRSEGLVSMGERLSRQIQTALKVSPINIINHQVTSLTRPRLAASFP